MDNGIVEQLGVGTNATGDIVANIPFYQTNVSGIFATGDSANSFKNIPSAIFQRANVGAVVPRDLPRRLSGHSTNRLQNGGLRAWLSR
jgi:pyruvate/2-oxoglutarate dehydrogenase complex dihydrolipoamide dehydrogenase (E3) component